MIHRAGIYEKGVSLMGLFFYKRGKSAVSPFSLRTALILWASGNNWGGSFGNRTINHWRLNIRKCL